MIDPLTTYAILPASDLQRARSFYRDKLGLEPSTEGEGMLLYSGPSGRLFEVYETATAGTAQNTQMGWTTSELEADMSELRARGVVFEEYDLPGLKTEGGVATTDTGRAAWFRDSEGNTLCVSQSGV
jgi:catechol 2,3-dioxygenase-like lactoylglutathione lyase family enzyme